MLCGEASIVKASHREIIAATLKCRAWGHPPCAEMRKHQLMLEVLAGKPTRFLTLTSRNRPDKTPTQAANELRDAWAILSREIIRKHGKDKCSFFTVIEKTKRGWPHLHVACRTPYLWIGWLSKRMGELHDSPQVWINEIGDLRRRASYVSKYMGKDPHRFAGCKRYWRSLDWLLDRSDDDTPVAHEGEGWQPDRRSLFEIECWCLGSTWRFWYEGADLHAAPLWPDLIPYEIESLHGPP